MEPELHVCSTRYIQNVETESIFLQVQELVVDKKQI